MHGFNCCLVFFQRNRIDFGMCLPKSVEHCGANDYGGIRQESSLFRHESLCGVKQSDSTLLLVIVTVQMNRPLSSRQVKKEKLRHEGLVPVSKGSQTL